jgi:putative flavoprotein involved in K+ transport
VVQQAGTIAVVRDGAGADDGWNLSSRASTHTRVGHPAAAGTTLRVVEHTHADGWCSISGGYVVRDPSLPELAGVDVYGDLCKRRVFGARAPGRAGRRPRPAHRRGPRERTAPGFERAVQRRVQSVENEERGVTIGEIASRPRARPGWRCGVCLSSCDRGNVKPWRLGAARLGERMETECPWQCRPLSRSAGCELPGCGSMAGSDVTERREVVVVGGGQAGLAIGYFLARRERDFAILEAAEVPGAAWRERWDSLKLFTPARYDALPGLAFPGDPGSYPGRDEVAAYLADYARHFALPVELGSRVRSIRETNGTYLVELADRTYEADQVVVATGPFQVPRVPPIADRLEADVVQLHSSSYRTPQAVPEGPVLVVGGGNTGFQIAKELAGSHEVHLSIGSRQTPLPQRVLGRDLFWYLEATGLLRTTTASRIGRRMEGRDTLIGSSPRALRRHHGVQLHGRAVDAAGATVSFGDGTTLDARTVIWATGFAVDHSWIDVPVFDDSGRVVHRRGVTASPGLYFLAAHPRVGVAGVGQG